ncbi:uncharacterized protein [Ambystoma mexicanum]|uniref:uncharacterized protein n=1 Tax=Ambystoma mexicanum TaxID=8296 RepID=UPI0037E9714A
MGRPRKDASSGGNLTSLGSTSAPASKPAASRSASSRANTATTTGSSSTRTKTATTGASTAVRTTQSAPSARVEAVDVSETIRSTSSQGSRKTTPRSCTAKPNISQGDMNNNREAGARSSTSESGTCRSRVPSASKAASSARSDSRGHATQPTSGIIVSRDGGQGEVIHTPNRGLGKAVKDIEIETRGQRENPKWHDWRENRITASMAHQIANSKYVNGRSSEVPQSYLKAVVTKSSGIQTPAMTWGIKNESNAVREYQQLKTKNGNGHVKVEDCGLYIHPEKTWLAASPDGIVKDSSTGKPIGLVEVKCPYKHKDHTIRDACKDDKFCLTPVGDTYTLKKDHPYYTQVQTQLAATGLKTADFVVYTKKETAIAPVEFDSKFWKATEPKLEKFYNEAVVPHLEKSRNPVWAKEE